MGGKFSIICIICKYYLLLPLISFVVNLFFFYKHVCINYIHELGRRIFQNLMVVSLLVLNLRDIVSLAIILFLNSGLCRKLIVNIYLF